jgi:hypothetical protein
MLSLKKAAVEPTGPWSVATMTDASTGSPPNGTLRFVSRMFSASRGASTPPGEEDVELDSLPSLPRNRSHGNSYTHYRDFPLSSNPSRISDVYNTSWLGNSVVLRVDICVHIANRRRFFCAQLHLILWSGLVVVHGNVTSHRAMFATLVPWS